MNTHSRPSRPAIRGTHATTRAGYRLLVAGTGAIAALLCLGGCGNQSDESNIANAIRTATQSASEAREAATPDAGDREKLNAYTDAHNKLIDTFGFSDTAENYRKAEIARRSPSDAIRINPGWIDQGLAKLKTARSTAGNLAEIDSAADTLIAALEKVVTRIKPLALYYSSRGYIADGLARGRQEDPLMLAEFDAASAAMDKFDAALTHERMSRNAAELAEAKARGDMLTYNNKLALQQSEELVGLFKSEADIGKEANFQKADALAAAIEKTLADQLQEIEKKKSDAQAHAVAYNSTVQMLSTMVGDYRSFRQSRDTNDFNNAVRNYNSAVSSSNMLQRF